MSDRERAQAVVDMFGNMPKNSIIVGDIADALAAVREQCALTAENFVPASQDGLVVNVQKLIAKEIRRNAGV